MTPHQQTPTRSPPQLPLGLYLRDWANQRPPHHKGALHLDPYRQTKSQLLPRFPLGSQRKRRKLPSSSGLLVKIQMLHQHQPLQEAFPSASPVLQQNNLHLRTLLASKQTRVKHLLQRFRSPLLVLDKVLQILLLLQNQHFPLWQVIPPTLPPRPPRPPVCSAPPPPPAAAVLRLQPFLLLPALSCSVSLLQPPVTLLQLKPLSSARVRTASRLPRQLLL